MQLLWNPYLTREPESFVPLSCLSVCVVGVGARSNKVKFIASFAGGSLPGANFVDKRNPVNLV